MTALVHLVDIDGKDVFVNPAHVTVIRASDLQKCWVVNFTNTYPVLTYDASALAALAGHARMLRERSVV